MEGLVIPIIALMIPMVIVPTALGFRHARLLRELEHRERIRAMEMGRLLPQDETWTTPARIVAAIGAGVPLAALATAFLASQALGFHEEIWIMSGMVGISGVVGGTYLAGRHLPGRDESPATAFKAEFDPDSLDVVSRRG